MTQNSSDRVSLERTATTLIYELLDAHEDTVRLASAGGLPQADVLWQVHLDYLRALQRAGREELAHTGALAAR